MPQPKNLTDCTLAQSEVMVELQSPDAAAAARFCASTYQPVLRSAADAGHVLPSSCRNGSCRACISQLDSGQITYRIDWPGLLPEEKAAGLFLPCVAYPLTDLVMQLGDAA
jgi:ferredoxin